MMRSLRQYIRQLIREETHVFHGYKFGPDKVGLPGPEFDDADTVTDEDVEDAAKWLEDNDPTELVAFSRGSAVLHQMMSDKPGVKVPSVTYVSPAALRKWTKAPVPPVPGGSKVVHSMGDNIVPLKQGCQIAVQSGAEMVVVPGMGDGRDHIKALKYKGGGGTGVDAAACANDPELPDWGDSGNASDEELEAQIKRAEELTSEVNLLREYIRRLLECGEELAMQPIMDPLFNMREMCKEFTLLEDHLNQQDMQCHDCINKHLMKCEALAEEAISLDKENRYPFIVKIPGVIRDWHQRVLDGESLEDLASSIRPVRKKLTPLVVDRFEA